MNFQTDLLDTVISVPIPWNRQDSTFGRVRAVYIAENRLRLVVLMTSGYLADIPADGALTKKEKDGHVAEE
jgi:hypothetical protein